LSVAPEPAIWFPAIRAGTGADVYTERLAEGLQRGGIRDREIIESLANITPGPPATPSPTTKSDTSRHKG
jgi:hypothetical protein